MDGSEPDISSSKFEKPFLIDDPTIIRAVSYDSATQNYSEVASKIYDISKKNWNVISVSSGDIESAFKIIDGNPKTSWVTVEEKVNAQYVTVDLGKEYLLKGFTYLPMQDRWIKGVITHYEFYLSSDNKNWKKVSEGEFGNIWNNPIEQKINFKPVKGRYFKFKATKIHGGEKIASFAEIGIITR
jgi:alpha-L-fucosidase